VRAEFRFGPEPCLGLRGTGQQPEPLKPITW